MYKTRRKNKRSRRSRKYRGGGERNETSKTLEEIKQEEKEKQQKIAFIEKTKIFFSKIEWPSETDYSKFNTEVTPKTVHNLKLMDITYKIIKTSITDTTPSIIPTNFYNFIVLYTKSQKIDVAIIEKIKQSSWGITITAYRKSNYMRIYISFTSDDINLRDIRMYNPN